ncbi:hypothetical protein ASC64_12535 [Nocardioides sp. Root122]|uniref:hypothetical protein n=1 Tax=Nocardioides TaxID=1839 RepID=UPI000702E82D|nr:MULTISPECIES: hypothetical protein [Nocardioides]KQV65733.1 hypothetical protein ASC64_12535 [Nocardioides sp. Root122]MCK9825653.1 hypothetical protein [Nocardioides cavernae]
MSRLKLWQSSVGILLFLLYWALIAACGDSIGAWSSGVRTTVSVVGVAAMVAGVVTFVVGLRTDPARSYRGEVVFLGFGLVLLGLVAVIATSFFDHDVAVTPELKFAVGVGGVALGGFVFAATQFDTIRAAASVPVVLLLIGVATWPGAADLMEPSVREALIKWMGILLGVNGVAEAGKQVGETFARSRGTREVAGTAGDLTSAE